VTTADVVAGTLNATYCHSLQWGSARAGAEFGVVIFLETSKGDTIEKTVARGEASGQPGGASA